MIKKIMVLCSLLLLSVALTGCIGKKKPADKTKTGEELYKAYLNLALPENAKSFSYKGNDTFPVFMSKAYFSYNVDKDFLQTLKNHDNFIEKSDFNKRIVEVSCDPNSFISDYSRWTDKPISITNKKCLKGIFFPYIHYFLYDEKNQHMDHFVEGMRD
jgi:hypothetical protein